MALSKDSSIFLDFVKMFMQYLQDHPEIGSFDPTIITGGSSKTIAQLVTEKEPTGTASTQLATLRGGYMGTLAQLVSDLQGRATTAQVDARIQQVVGAAPAALDTLVELATALTENQTAVGALVTGLSSKVNAVPGKGLSTVDVTPEMLVQKSPDGIIDEDELPPIGVLQSLVVAPGKDENGNDITTWGVNTSWLDTYIANYLANNGGGGTTPPAGLTNAISEVVAPNQQPRLSLVNDVMTFSSPNDSIPLSITESGGTGPYTRVWTFTSPDGSGFWDNNNTSGNTVSLLGIGKNDAWSISCETTDSAGTKKKSTLNFTVVGYGGTGGGGGTLEGTIVPRSKANIGAPDNSIDFLISVKGGTPPYSASFSKMGASGASGGESFTDSGAGFPAAGYTGFRSYVHSVNVSGNYESVVVVNDNAGNSKEFRIGFTVSGY